MVVIDPAYASAIADLEMRMDKVEKNWGNMTYSTYSQTFTSQSDVRKFIEDIQIEKCGSYWDHFSCLWLKREPRS